MPKHHLYKTQGGTWMLRLSVGDPVHKSVRIKASLETQYSGEALARRDCVLRVLGSIQKAQPRLLITGSQLFRSTDEGPTHPPRPPA
jgi:hypothetical protein